MRGKKGNDVLRIGSRSFVRNGQKLERGVDESRLSALGTSDFGNLRFPNVERPVYLRRDSHAIH